MAVKKAQFGWLLDFLFNAWVRRMIEKLLSEVGGQLPITITWQTGTVKGRIVVDEI